MTKYFYFKIGRTKIMKFKNTRTKYLYFNINKLKFHIFENRENKIAFKQKNYYTLCNKIEDSLY